MTTAALGDLVYSGAISVSPYDVFKARVLLAMGANPNHMVLDEEITIVELAAQRCEESLIWVFVNDVGADFNVRPGFDKRSPLAQLLKRHYDDTDAPPSTKLLLAVYARMTIQNREDSPLLLLALEAERYDLAVVMIQDRVGTNRVGYYNYCMSCTPDAIACAWLLYDCGYRRTDMFSYECRPASVYYDPRTALEAVPFYDECSTGMMDVLAPFAEITIDGIGDIAYGPYTTPYTIDLLKRCMLRDIPSKKETRPGMYTIRDALQRYSQGTPQIAAVIECHNTSQLPSFYNGPNELCVGPNYDDGVTRFLSTSCIELLVVVFLKQGEMPHESMLQFPALRDALQPWNPRLTRMYFSAAFLRRAALLLVCIALRQHDMPMPLEGAHKIIEFIDRTYEPNSPFV